MSKIEREGKELKLIISPREANELLQGGTVLNSGYVISQDINLENQKLQKENQELREQRERDCKAIASMIDVLDKLERIFERQAIREIREIKGE